MSEKIRWGILGTARIARNALIPAMQSASNAVPQAVASRDVEKAASFASDCKVAASHASYEALLADPDVDAIYIPLPVGLHATWARACAEAGKPVLCEKPITADVGELRELVSLFDEKGLLLVEAFMYRYHPLNRKVRELVREGAVGKPLMLRSAFYTEIAEDDIRYKKELAGGALGDLGCYCVGIMRYLLDEEPDQAAALANFVGGDGVDEAIGGCLHFPSGAIGTFGCSMSGEFDCSYEVQGEKGRLIVERGAMVAWPGEDFKIRLIRETEEEVTTVPSANHYQLMVEDVSAALLEGRKPAFPVEGSVAGMELIDRLFESARKA